MQPVFHRTRRTGGSLIVGLFFLSILAGGCSGGSSDATLSPEAARGQAIFNGIGTCPACHDVAKGAKLIGPSLKGVAGQAASRVPGLSAQAYLRESILEPDKFVVPGFKAGLMPQTFAATFNAEQLDGLIAYLMTLR
jgi:cytochrome c2